MTREPSTVAVSPAGVAGAVVSGVGVGVAVTTALGPDWLRRPSSAVTT